MATPFSFTGSLNISSDPSLSPEAIPFNLSAQYSSMTSCVLTYSGIGTSTVPLGTVDGLGAKLVAIKVAALPGALPILVKMGATGVTPTEIEISPGGFILLGSPSPLEGITQISIERAADATVTVTVAE